MKQNKRMDLSKNKNYPKPLKVKITIEYNGKKDDCHPDTGNHGGAW